MKRISLFLLLAVTGIFCCACGDESGGKAKEENLSELVTVVGEYTSVDSLGQGEHILVVKNNSSKTVQVDTNVTVKDASDKIIGAKATSIDAIASGSEACIVTPIFDISGATDFQYTISVEEDTRYESSVQDVSFEQSLVDDKVVVICTNNGEESVKNTEVNALFFQNGEYVCRGINWIPEIKAGATVSIEVRPYGTYQNMTCDEAKVYLYGWR